MREKSSVRPAISEAAKSCEYHDTMMDGRVNATTNNNNNFNNNANNSNSNTSKEAFEIGMTLFGDMNNIKAMEDDMNEKLTLVEHEIDLYLNSKNDNSNDDKHVNDNTNNIYNSNEKENTNNQREEQLKHFTSTNNTNNTANNGDKISHEARD